MKKISLLILLFCFLTGCSNEKANEKANEEVPIPHGVKPVIFYKNQLYWMSTDKASYELPKGYSASEDEIIESEKDADIVPSQECFTSAMNSNNVGAEIYTNPDDPNIILIYTGEKYITFVYE